jgi:hypothetical protein
MTVARYAVGVAATLCVIGSFGSAGVALRRRVMPDRGGALGRLAEVVLAVALLELTLQALGAVGLFSLVPVVLASLTVGLGARSWEHRSHHKPRSIGAAGAVQRIVPLDALGIGLALLATGTVLAVWAGITVQSLQRGVLGFDSLSYHLPWAASFAQSHKITSILYTDFDWLTGFYPATSEMFHGLGIVLMGSDVLSPVLNLGWLVGALLAGWCIGESRGVGPAALVGAAIPLATPMVFFSTPGTADSDALGVFLVLAAAALWLGAVDNSHRDPPRGARRRPAIEPWSLVPAAAATGLALSVKLNLAASVLAITAAALLTMPSGDRLRAARVWLGTTVLTGGFWYLRNLLTVGNPLPYFGFGVLPTPTPPPAQSHNNYAISDYLTRLHWLANVARRALVASLGSQWAAILVVAVLGAALCVAFGRGRTVRLLGLVALFSIVAYLFTPGSASGSWGLPRGLQWNMRYAAPALSLALAAGPLSAPFARRGLRWVALAGLGWLLLATVENPSYWNAIYNRTAQIATAVVITLVGFAIVARTQRWIPLAPVLPRLAVITVAACLGGAGVAAAYGVARNYLRTRYTVEPGVPSITVLWRWANRLHHQRIAVTGTFGWYFGYPLYGDDDTNHVAYLGHHGRHGAFTSFPTCRAMRTALNRGHYDFVVTSVGRIWTTRALVPSPEGGWIARDPAVRLLFKYPRRGSSLVQVWKLSGALQPDCRGSRRKTQTI